VSILFVLVYVGADAWTARRAVRHRVDFSWEASMPFVPQTIWIYSSIYLVFAAVPFVLRSPREIAALAMALSAVILAGAAGFLLLPARLAYPAVPLSGDPVTLALFRASDRLNLEYNLLPSLHVALSSTTLGALATRARASGRLLLAACAVAIGLSTVLTHQHHVLDVAAGYAVAAAALSLVYRPWSAGSGRSS
jgi:membrane-associated phospholipid phosphatase